MKSKWKSFSSRRTAYRSAAYLLAGLLLSCLPSADDSDPESIRLTGVRRPTDTTVFSEDNLHISLWNLDTLVTDLKFDSLQMPKGALLIDGDIFWGPEWGQVGVHTFRVAARSPSRPGEREIIAFKVKVQPHKFFYSSPGGNDTTLLVGQTYGTRFWAQVPTGDKLVFTYPEKPDGAVLHDTSGLLAIMNFSWTPGKAQTGVFRFTGIATNQNPPIAKDTVSFQITVLANAPADYQTDTSTGALRIGDFAPLAKGSRWLYSTEKTAYDQTTFLSSTTQSGTYEVQVQDGSAEEGFAIKVTRILNPPIHTGPGLPDLFRDPTFKTATYHCSTAQGCDADSFLGQPIPFYTRNFNRGPLDHFVTIGQDTALTLQKEYRESSTVYVLRSAPGSYPGGQYISNTGLESWGTTSQDSLIQTFHWARLLEYQR